MFKTQYDKARILRRARRHLRKHHITPPKMTMKFTRVSPFDADVRLVRRGDNSIDVEVQFMRPEMMLDGVRRRISTPVHQFMHCAPEVAEMGICLGDGAEQSINPFAFSSNRPDVVLLPDHYQFIMEGYPRHRAAADSDTKPWKSRRSTLRWRGSDTGDGRVIFDHEDAAYDPTVKARIRLCLIANGLPDTDCKIAKSTRPNFEPMYQHNGILGAKIEELDWINDRYALDIDGNTNAWSNMVTRMHLGCCVLKVESQFGFRQWHYDRIKPWEHFVPVKADMSDLEEKLDWVRSNDEDAERIAKNGQAFARTFTLESCAIEGAEIIEKHYLGKTTGYAKEHLVK
ncbi:MAG: glycosyl transferase family 90 [Pseudomonadota bacterium]